MSTLSEGELHVQAMRLVCEALADREKTGLEVDWDVINHMHDHMDVIFRGIEDQRRDDQDELMHTRKDRDAAHEQICTLRDQMKAEIETLRKELDAAQAETVDVRRQRNNETDRLNATNAVSVQQRDEIAYLRTRLDEERSVIAGLRQKLDAAQSEIEAQRKAMADDSSRLRKAEERVWPGIGSASDPAKAMADEILGLRQQLDAANAAWNLQCARIERLNKFVWKVRWADCYTKTLEALAELDAEPTPVAEPLDAEGGK